MQNLFGLTEEDLAAVLTADAVMSEEEKANHRQVLKNGFANDPRWVARSKKIARLPGLPDEAKLACMFLGPGAVLSQLLILQGVALHEQPLETTVAAFAAYMDAIGEGLWRSSEWVTAFVFLGAFSYEGVGTPSEDLDGLSVTERGIEMAESSSHYLDGFASNILPMKEVMEELGIVFEDDPTMFQ